MSGEPLRGLTVVVTRPRHQAPAFSERLRALGARVVEAPAVEIRSPRDRGPLLRAAGAVSEYDWIVFTSANGVRAFADALGETGGGPALPERLRTAAIGPGTASALAERLGAEADVVPPGSYRAEALADAILEAVGSAGGIRVLLPRAADARPVLRERLREAGAEVDEVAAYRSVPAVGEGSLSARVRSGEVDWLTFTASSTVAAFVDAVGPDVRPARVAVIGPVTAGTAHALDLPVDAVADEYTIDGLLEALVEAAGAAEGAAP